MWTLHIHFDPTRIGYLYFWLLTTGYRNTERNKRTQDEIDSLNTALMIKENLNDIYTTNPEKTLRFGRYVLGQYINYKGLKSKNSKTHLHPETYGVIIKPDVLKELKERQDTLVLNTIDRSKNTITIDESLSENELELYENIKKIFGSIFLKDQKETLNKHTQEDVISILQKKLGIKMPPDTDYNHLLHLFFKSLNKVYNRYI